MYNEYTADFKKYVFAGVKVSRKCQQSIDCGDNMTCTNELDTSLCACNATYIPREDGSCGQKSLHFVNDFNHWSLTFNAHSRLFILCGYQDESILALRKYVAFLKVKMSEAVKFKIHLSSMHIQRFYMHSVWILFSNLESRKFWEFCSEMWQYSGYLILQVKRHEDHNCKHDLFLLS